ncbi:MAG: DUF2330 domain-containing protein [Rhodobacterales bacterium]|nr:DUF2330 domain-containing protein [Rhodobacterales bacterium]
MSRTLLTMALGLAISPVANACGGFFCDQDEPVDQNAERIVFAIDEAAGRVESHVQIFYQGPSDDFAWVVPVPNNPEVFLSSTAMFDQLAQQLAPSFQLKIKEEGKCTYENKWGRSEYSMDSGVVSSSDVANESDGVSVVQEGQVGPYDMVVLQAQSSAELIAWLGDNGYDIPISLDPLLAPYVAADSYFLALKLSKNSDSGDIEPIAFSYEGTQPSIPIQLTSVAATPDMRLEAYVFAENRTVPESYLHVQINEAAIDWWSAGSNYNDVITKAANEAGGHAFATDYAGSTDLLQGSLLTEGQYELDGLRSISRFGDFINEVQGMGLPASGALANALMSCVDAPAGVEATAFLNCPDCYDNWDPSSFDADTCADILDETIVAPMRAAEEMFSAHPIVSRLTSSLSAAEMTVDPVFVQNPDMGQVSNQHNADFIYDCNGKKRRNKAIRRLELEDGRVILLPSELWLAEEGMTEFEFLADFGEVNAQVIEETSGSGNPNVLFDYTDNLFTQADEHNDRVLGLLGCGGCSATGSAPASGFLLPLFAVGLLRRRRS